MKKIEWIDILKGIGIISVVAGHIYGGLIRELISVFHMPLFFFLGGVLCKPKQDYWGYAKAKSIHLLVPYLVFLLILYSIQVVEIVNNLTEFSGIELAKIMTRPLLGGHLFFGLTSVFWFTPCFFLTQQLSNILIDKLNPKQILVIMSIMLVLSYLNYLVFPKIWLPWGAHILLASTPFFLSGFLFQKIHTRYQKYYGISIPIFVIVIASIIVYQKQEGDMDFLMAYDMKHTSYGIPLVSFVAAIGIILFLIDLANILIVRIPVVVNVVNSIGRASMVVMYLHMPFVYLYQSLPIRIKSNFYMLIFSTLVCWVTYLLLSRFSFSRALFLGSKTDFEKIIAKIS